MAASRYRGCVSIVTKVAAVLPRTLSETHTIEPHGHSLTSYCRVLFMIPYIVIMCWYVVAVPSAFFNSGPSLPRGALGGAGTTQKRSLVIRYIMSVRIAPLTSS